MEDDLQRTLHELTNGSQQSIVSQLLEIRKHQFEEPRSFAWARNFTCLSIDEDTSRERERESKVNRTILSRVKVPISTGDYVVVSYRWDEPDSFDQYASGYFIKSGFGWEARPSESSNAVLNRIVKYVDHVGAPAFWIDKDCIDQQDAAAKADAVQVMDLVYRCSNWPVAVLTIPIQHQDDLDMLRKLLSGEMTTITDVRGPMLAHWVKTRPQLAYRILRLLFNLVSDPWWTRRWTFQEEYCSYTTMELLVPHDEHLSKHRWDGKSQAIEGEIVVEASRFREQATLFCLASRKLRIFRNERDQRKIRQILKRAKSYRTLHYHDPELWSSSSARTLSTRILADIAHRGSKSPGDLLAITANCCSYSIRLDDQRLAMSRQPSISLAILALFLLNGEIIWNYSKSGLSYNIWRFLGSQAFSEFEFPEDSHELTFMKRCRLVNVRLSREGILTTGHLWQAHSEISTKNSRIGLRPKMSQKSRISECLRWLSRRLRKMSHHGLASELDNLVDSNMSADLEDTGLNNIFRQMALTVADAVASGRDLVVARLVNKPHRHAIFVANWRPQSRPMFVFTASEPAAKFSTLVEKHPSPPKYVSLRVQVHEPTSRGLPRLSVRGWVNGMAFPETTCPARVAFRWPSCFEGGTLQS